jgi:NAD(P)-dependent dehydrogenase (short-subunit alcohol dehydrogenase family)
MADTIALITGANKGIGFEIARQLAKRGVHVIVGARNEDNGRKAADVIRRDGGQADAVKIDVDDPSGLKNAAKVVAKFGHLDVLVNNAGIYPDKNNSLVDTDPGVVWTAIRTNALGPMITTQAFLPLLEKSRQPRVINMSSGMGSLSEMESAYGPAYSISKTTLNAVTRQLAASLKEKKVAVNSMCPGWVKTDMGGPNAPRSPETAADTAVWLALDAPQDLTGRFIRDRQTIPW